jgi:hypothetical protein
MIAPARAVHWNFEDVFRNEHLHDINEEAIEYLDLFLAWRLREKLVFLWEGFVDSNLIFASFDMFL